MILRRACLAFAVLALGLSTASAAAAELQLGTPHAQVRERLGTPAAEGASAACPDHRIERHVRGQRWLKLVFDPHDKLAAVSISVLSAPASGQPLVLRWPGIEPGLARSRPYAARGDWRPWFHTQGAKQTIWFERDAAPPPGRQRYLGSVAVSDASSFALGRDFPHLLAADFTAAPQRGLPIEASAVTRPLLSWRRRTAPNAFIETLADAAQGTTCDLFQLARMDYSDLRSQR